jgi:hypothetical protein
MPDDKPLQMYLNLHSISGLAYVSVGLSISPSCCLPSLPLSPNIPPAANHPPPLPPLDSKAIFRKVLKHGRRPPPPGTLDYIAHGGGGVRYMPVYRHLSSSVSLSLSARYTAMEQLFLQPPLRPV